eukprot:2207776-Ditylum_brightwellii.AAC.2
MPEGLQQWRPFESLLVGLPLCEWKGHKKTTTSRLQAEFRKNLELWLQDFMEETVSNDILEWLHILRTPYDMSVLDFVHWLDELNNL